MRCAPFHGEVRNWPRPVWVEIGSGCHKQLPQQFEIDALPTRSDKFIGDETTHHDHKAQRYQEHNVRQ